jgi:hypothetical protein
MASWHPLTDHWMNYQQRINDADAEGLLDDPLGAQEIIYPDELSFGEGEKEDVREFVEARLNELYANYQNIGGKFDINAIGTYIFRSIILGMMWESERIGR